MDTNRLIYLHGLESTSNSGKARLFREWFPGMLTPDFKGTFEQRMEQLYSILGNQKNWTIIGSSYGGLMGAVFTRKHPEQVRKLILLAPALTLPEFNINPPVAVSVPTVIVHGTQDNILPLGIIRSLAEKVFTNLDFYVVEDNHRLHKAIEELDWKNTINST